MKVLLLFGERGRGTTHAHTRRDRENSFSSKWSESLALLTDLKPAADCQYGGSIRDLILHSGEKYRDRDQERDTEKEGETDRDT